MACYGPLTGYRPNAGPEGDRRLVFDPRKAVSGLPIPVPCGQCIGCRLDWSLGWAIRCMSEKRLHADSAFLTLTYDDDHLPKNYSLNPMHLTLFMKRLRMRLGTGLRFFACGEYGELTQRPHYHVLLLNYSFNDRKMDRQSKSGSANLYVSATLSNLWEYGHANFGEVTLESCAYVASYCTKKLIISDKTPLSVLQRNLLKLSRVPEFHRMSRRPGIGMDAFARFNGEWFRADSMVMSGKEKGIPRYFDVKFEEANPAPEGRLLSDLDRIKRDRRSRVNKADNTQRRLMVRERFEILKRERFMRDF